MATAMQTWHGGSVQLVRDALAGERLWHRPSPLRKLLAAHPLAGAFWAGVERRAPRSDWSSAQCRAYRHGRNVGSASSDPWEALARWVTR